MTTRFNPDRGYILVLVTILGPVREATVRMALDTGASRTSLDRQIASELGFEVTRSTETARIATGSMYETVPVILAGRVEALGNHRVNLPILCKSLPPGLTIDGLLGLDFFRNQKLTIDFREGMIALE